MAEDDSLIDAASLQKDALIEKLTRRICIQDTQLGNLGNSFNGSAEYIKLCECRIRELESEASMDPEMKEDLKQQNLSEAASRRHVASEVLAQLDESERLLTISNEKISELERNLRTKERQCKLNDKKVLELGRETQKMRLQIESFHHTSRLISNPIESNSARKVVKGLKSEVDALKAYVASYQSRLETSKTAERILAVKVFDLEESRDYQSQGAYKELQARVLMLTDKVRLLKIELQTEKERATDLLISSSCDSSEIKGNGDAVTSVCIKHYDEAASDQKCAMSSARANSDCDEKVIALERIIVSLQLKIDEVESGGETNQTFGNDGMTRMLREAEQERDILLEFIRGDMKNSADVGEELQKEKEITDHLRNNLKDMQIKESLLYTEISNLRLSVCNGKQNMKVYDSEDCIVSILSGELRTARARIEELESGIESDVAELRVDKNECDNVDRQNTEALMVMPMEDSNVSSPPTVTLNISPPPVSTLNSSISTSTPNSISVVEQPWKQITSHDLDVQLDQSDWQLEKAALIKELNAMRPIDRALAELAKDLKSFIHKEDYDGFPDDMEGCTLPDEQPIRSYSSMYSKTMAANGKNSSSTSARDSVRKNKLAISLPKNRATAVTLNPLMRNARFGIGKQSGVTGLGHTCSDRPHGLLSQMHSWVGLPSIARLSVALSEKIKRLLVHLHKSEKDYFELTEHISSVESASHKSAMASEQIIQDLTFAAETAEEKRRYCEDLLERYESDLKSERGAFCVVESIFDVLRGVPGGWEEFFDKNSLEFLPAPKVGHDPSIFNRNENSLAETSSHWPRKMQRIGNIENTLVSSMRGIIRTDGGRIHGAVNGGSGQCSKLKQRSHLNSKTKSSGLVWTIDGSRDDSCSNSSSTPSSLRNMERCTTENSPIFSSGVREEYISIIPPALDLLPLIMSRAISMILALSSELRESEMEEISKDSLLSNCQNKLKSREIEYEELKNQFHRLELRYESREHSFVRIESAMKNDLDLIRFHSTEQNIKVLELGSQLDSQHRDESDQHKQQLYRRQKDAYDKEELCNALRDYGYPHALDAFTLSWSDITKHTRNILHDIVQSYQKFPKDLPCSRTLLTPTAMSLPLLSSRSTPLIETTARSAISLESLLISNSAFRSAESINEGSTTNPNPPYPSHSQSILTPSTDESLEDMESCMTPTTDGSDSHEDDDNDIELSHLFIQGDGIGRIYGEEEGGSEKDSHSIYEMESMIENEDQYKHTEINSDVSPISFSGLLSSPRIVPNRRQYFHSGVHSKSQVSSVIESPENDNALVHSRQQKHHKDLIHCYSDIRPHNASVSSSLRHASNGGEIDDEKRTVGISSNSYVRSSTPPALTPRANICPTEVLDFRLRKAKEIFSSLREDIRSDF